MNKLLALLVLGIAMPAFATATYTASAHSSETTGQASNVATAEDTTATRTLVSAYLVAAGNATTMAVGATLQFTAYGTYSDGTVAVIPNEEGAGAIAWNTSNHAVARMSELGHATALSKGSVDIQAMIGTIEASPFALTVGTAAQTPSPDITVISPINGPTIILPAWDSGS